MGTAAPNRTTEETRPRVARTATTEDAVATGHGEGVEWSVAAVPIIMGRDKGDNIFKYLSAIDIIV